MGYIWERVRERETDRKTYGRTDMQRVIMCNEMVDAIVFLQAMYRIGLNVEVALKVFYVYITSI